MDSLMNNDSGSTVADLHTKRYYRMLPELGFGLTAME